MLVSIMTMSDTYPEIWDYFEVPQHIDKQMVMDTIMIECAEMELLYSDPDILKYIIKVWTRREKPVWDELQKTLEYKYNPIWNVEGSEKTERTLEGSENTDETNVRTPDLTNERTPDLTYERTPDLTTTDNVTGYNSNTLVTNTSQEIDGTDTNTETGTETITETGTDTNTRTGIAGRNEKETTVFTRGMNIGVMSTQALIKEQREIVQFTVAEFIMNSFKTNFCLMVY